MAEAKRRADELERLLCKIYEDKLLGRLAESRYAVLDERYANEQEQLIREIETLEATIATYENRQQSSERFIALLDKYERFDPLTTTMLNEFVEKILVHERARKGSVETTQEVEIYFKFIGKYVPPHFGEMKLTPEEAEALRKREERKDKLHQAYLRRKASGAQKKYEDKVRAKKKAEREAKSAALRADAIARGIFIPSVSCPRRHPGERRSKTALQFEKTSSGGMKCEQVPLSPRWRLLDSRPEADGTVAASYRQVRTYAAAVFEKIPTHAVQSPHPDRAAPSAPGQE